MSVEELLHVQFFKNYCPQFYFRTTHGIIGKIELLKCIEMVMPGDNINMKVTLITPIGVDEEIRFAIHKCDRTVYVQVS